MTTLKKRAFEDSWLYFILITLFCMNLFGRGSIVCLAFAVYALFKMPRRIIIDRCGIVAFFLTVVTFVASLVYTGIMEAIKCLNFFLMYFIGANSYHISTDKKNLLKKTIFAIFSGFAILVILTYFSNLEEVHIAGKRIIKNFWTGEDIAVTLVGLLCSVVIGYFPYAVWWQQRKSIKLFALFSLIIVFLVNTQTATRTPIVLFAIVSALMAGIYLVDQKGIKAVKTIAMIVVIIAGIILLIGINVFGIRTYIESTPLYERFIEEGTETSRTDIFFIHLRYMFDYPWGGSKISGLTGYLAHNFLQQGYDLYGIGAAVFLLILGLSFIKNVFILIRSRRKSDVDYLLISLYLAMTIQALLEPVFTGYPCFFFCLLLIHGMATEYLRSRNRCEYENC